MAKKKQETASLIETFAEFKQNKNIDLTTMVGVLEESFRSVIAKIFGSDENFDVIVNPDKGDCEIYRNRVVVNDDEVEDPNKQISLSEAQKIDATYEVGEDVSEEIHFADFGRRAILTLRQTLASKILELEHDALYNKYKDRVGELITAEVYQTWKSETLLMDEEKNELWFKARCMNRAVLLVKLITSIFSLCNSRTTPFETAKDVLNAPREMLIEKADLEESTVDEVLRVLRAEFENDAPQAPAAQPTAEAPADANEPAAEPAGSSSYCLSSSFWLGSLLATGAPFSFRRSVIDCKPTPNSLIALFNLILMQ